MIIREKILVIEDEKSISRLICSVLRKQEYEVIQAWSGKEAMMLLSSACPDLVILDLGLPDMMAWRSCGNCVAGPVCR